MLIRYFESEKIAAGSRAGWAGPTSLGRSVALSIIMCNGLSGSLFTRNKNCPPLSDARLDFLRLTHFQVKNIDLHLRIQFRASVPSSDHPDVFGTKFVCKLFIMISDRAKTRTLLDSPSL